MTNDWLAFWDSQHSIFVSARHKDAHYRLLANEIAAFVGDPQARVLDYGCGEALHADVVAAAAGELWLCDVAPGVREGLQQRFADNAKIRVIGPHEIARLPEHSLDLIVVHSVTQYLSATGAGALFALFHRLMKPGGLLVVSDVIPPRRPAAADAFALIRFAMATRFFFAALFALVRPRFSNYRKLRSRLGLTRYAADAMIEKLNAAGFDAQRALVNIGHNQGRATFYARPR
jgi:SAM-dependent methyltransferase